MIGVPLIGIAMVATVAAGHASADQSRAKPHVVTSSTVDVFVEDMYASATTVPVGGQTTINVVLNTDITNTPYYIEVFNEVTGALVGWCGKGSTCPVIDSAPGFSENEYVAFLSDLTRSLPPTGSVAASNLVRHDNHAIP